MALEIKELRERRAKLIADAREAFEAATAEGAADGAVKEAEARFDKSMAESEVLKAKADRLEKLEAEERQLDEVRHVDAGREPVKPGTPAAEAEKRAMQGFATYLRTGQVYGAGADEFRALQAASNTEGGYLKPPPAFVASLIQDLDNQVFVRGVATKYTVQAGQSLGAPSLDTDMDDGTWTSELLTGSEDTALRFGRRELNPHPMAKSVKVSKTLIRATAAGLSIVDIVRQRLAYKVGVTQEKGYMTGTGNNQPLGLFTASNDGVPTTQDVSTGNTTTSITFDGLIEAKYKLKGQYWGRASWMFHRDACKQITKLKDGDGQYIWRQSVREGEADMLLGRPFMMSEYAPNTFTTLLYVGILGDFSFYWIADSLQMELLRLVELYAATNQVGLIGRLESDGMPVLGEAFVRVKMG